MIQNKIQNYQMNTSRTRQTTRQQHRLEGISEVCSLAHNRFNHIGMFTVLSRWVLNTCRDRDSTTSPGNLFHCLTTIITICFPYFEMEFPVFQLPHILPLWASGPHWEPHCWLLFNLSTRISRSFSAKLLSNPLVPQTHYMPSERWDIAFVFIQLHDVPINPFLQPIKMSLNSRPVQSPQ